MHDEKYKLRFTASFEATVTVETGGSLVDAIASIVVPEDAVSRYVPNTFVPAADADGNLIVWDEAGTPL